MSNRNATPAQISFYNNLLDLAARLGYEASTVEAARRRFPARTVADASEAITRAKATVARLQAAAPAAVAPVVQAKGQPAPVADGHYALVKDDVVKFYRVRTPQDGSWAGFTFLDAQASDDYFPIKGASRHAIMAEIAADDQALARYGQTLGICGACRRTLTDETSRALGLGPICRNR